MRPPNCRGRPYANRVVFDRAGAGAWGFVATPTPSFLAGIWGLPQAGPWVVGHGGTILVWSK
ncbi:MAG: hypothetical protein CSA65_03040 [Proteobacteria bacterium]|nr:MAG: hypothetical protein CSA65_03040 [Pseudomonadota bacterium]